MSACVFMCIGVFVCLNTSKSSLFSQSRSIILLNFFLYQSFFSPSTYVLLQPCAARSPGVRFPVVGPAVSPLPNLLKMLPLLVSWADSWAQRWDFLPRSRKGFIRLVSSGILSCPHLLTNLVDGAQVRVVHQLHEVPVPKLLVGNWGATSAAGF